MVLRRGWPERCPRTVQHLVGPLPQHADRLPDHVLRRVEVDVPATGACELCEHLARAQPERSPVSCRVRRQDRLAAGMLRSLAPCTLAGSALLSEPRGVVPAAACTAGQGGVKATGVTAAKVGDSACGPRCRLSPAGRRPASSGQRDERCGQWREGDGPAGWGFVRSSRVVSAFWSSRRRDPPRGPRLTRPPWLSSNSVSSRSPRQRDPWGRWPPSRA